MNAMWSAAPRLDRRLMEAIIRIDDPSVPIAEVHRRSREHAANLGIPRPSYECTRMLVHAARRERARRRANRETLIRIALYLDDHRAVSKIEHGSYLPK